MTGIKKIVALVGIITFVLGSVTVADAKTNSNQNKEVNLTVEVGEKITIKGIKKAPDVKGLTV